MDLSLHALAFCKKLQMVDNRISDQLFRALTPIGANAHEAQNAKARKILFMKLCEKSKYLIFDKELNNHVDEVNRILSKIISSTKKISY